MSDMSVMVERIKECEEMDKLRAEIAALRAQWDDYATVAKRAYYLGCLNAFSHDKPTTTHTVYNILINTPYD